MSYFIRLCEQCQEDIQKVGEIEFKAWIILCALYAHYLHPIPQTDVLKELMDETGLPPFKTVYAMRNLEHAEYILSLETSDRIWVKPLGKQEIKDSICFCPQDHFKTFD